MSEITKDETLIESFRIQCRIIGALLLREILTRFGRHNIGFLWLFVEPMVFTIGVAVLWSFTKAIHGSSLPIVAFALTGYSSVLLWRNMPARCISAIEPNLALLFHRNVKIIDIFISRVILEGMGATMSFMFLAVFFTSIGWMDLPEDVLKIIFAWFMLAWFGVALALFLGSLAESVELVDKLWHPASYLLFPLSGSAFMVDALPVSAQQYVLALPMVNGVELLREGYFGSAVKAHYDMGYMALWNLGLSLLAMAQVRKAGREVMPG